MSPDAMFTLNRTHDPLVFGWLAILIQLDCLSSACTLSEHETGDICDYTYSLLDRDHFSIKYTNPYQANSNEPS